MKPRTTETRMTKTYAQLKQQIATLSREAETLLQKERDGVINRIVEAIAVYELTAADLGLAGKAGGKAPAKAPGKAPRKGAARKAARSKAPAEAKYRDATGNVWGGRGPRPQWLRAALTDGKTLQDFAVQ